MSLEQDINTRVMQKLADAVSNLQPIDAQLKNVLDAPQVIPFAGLDFLSQAATGSGLKENVQSALGVKDPLLGTTNPLIRGLQSVYNTGAHKE
jgi:hypothetical protein